MGAEQLLEDAAKAVQFWVQQYRGDVRDARAWSGVLRNIDAHFYAQGAADRINDWHRSRS